MKHASLKRAIRAAQGLEPSDCVIKGAKMLDVISGELHAGDVAICGQRIVGTQANYDAEHYIDGEGLIIVPGFIDTHLHIESSLVTPFEFEQAVLPLGVTTAICDPHEIANVCGVQGIEFFLAAAEQMQMDLWVNLSSCVPATDFETSGARLKLADLIPLANYPKVLGLAEFMNYPAIIQGSDDALDKTAFFSDRHIDGHAPQVTGKELNAYLCANIRTDHEATTLAEAREKLSKGMRVLIREGSVSKDLDALAEMIDANSAAYVALCTDDRNPLEISEEGHLDAMIRRLLAKGLAPHLAYRVASLSGAMAFGLRDRGLIAPGYRADLVLLRDLENCTIEQVICAGKLYRKHPDKNPPERTHLPAIGRNSIKLAKIAPDCFKIPCLAQPTSQPVIGILPGKIITEYITCPIKRSDGYLISDPANDVLKVAVLERHGKNGNVGLGWVRGFGLHTGAIASSVGHDSHNICVVGVSDIAMARAVNRIIDMQGGFVVNDDTQILAELPLPIAGLMSEQPFLSVSEQMKGLKMATKSLGCSLDEAFLQLAFIPLPVIPALKLTDKGLFDVTEFRLLAQ